MDQSTDIAPGYGLTESTAMACILNPAWLQLGTVGGPVPASEIKLVDAKEAGYFSTNDPPQGEIYLRGPAIFKGYFKRPELDKEAFTEDGWFKTGDVGQWQKDGCLVIIDRLKNLVKLAGGEYIAVEHLESVYKSCPIIANGAIIAAGDHNQPMMVCMAHPVNLPAFAKKNGLSNSDDLEALCKDEKVIEAAHKELNATGKKNGLKGLELLESIVLAEDEWTPESGFLTAAQSESIPAGEIDKSESELTKIELQRKKIESHYGDRIKVSRSAGDRDLLGLRQLINLRPFTSRSRRAETSDVVDGDVISCMEIRRNIPSDENQIQSS